MRWAEGCGEKIEQNCVFGEPYAVYLGFYEGYRDIRKDAIQNVLYALLGVFAVGLILVPNLIGVIVLTALIAMVTFDIFGAIYYIDFDLNSVTLTLLVMSVGLTVDYSAHMMHTYFRIVHEEYEHVKCNLKMHNVMSNIRNIGGSGGSPANQEGELSPASDVPILDGVENTQTVDETFHTNAEIYESEGITSPQEGNHSAAADVVAGPSLSNKVKFSELIATEVKNGTIPELSVTYPRCKYRIDDLYLRMGRNILAAGITTFLAICPLAFARSVINRIFFYLFAFIVGLGVAHGLFLVPILMSLGNDIWLWWKRRKQ